MSSIKLAFKNVGKSIRDYAIYFLTLALGVCIFYVFNSMDSQALLVNLSAAQGGVLEMLVTAIDATSIFVSAILAFLIVYANKFLMRRRKKELGVYLILGMPKGKVSFVLAMETFIIGLCSGLMGIGLSRLLLIPGNMLIQKIAVGTSVVAVLPWKASVVLVALATVLTILGGFIPAKTASRSDPVKALRAE